MISAILRTLFLLFAVSLGTVSAQPGQIIGETPTPIEAPAVTEKAAAATTVVIPTEDPHAKSDPWLYIIIGFLIVTGIFLYVDPKMF